MTGRREQQLVVRVPEMVEVARWLRRSRRLSRLTYRQLAQATGRSRGSLQRAASGSRSSWPVVEAFARACGADVGEARHLWLQAKAALEGADQDPEVVTVHQVDTFEDLRSAMTRLRAVAGGPTLRELEARAAGKLARTTLSSALRGDSPPRRALVVTFAEVVGVGADQAAAWGAAWDRADALSRSAREITAPAQSFSVTPAPALLLALAGASLPPWRAVAELVDVTLSHGGNATGEAARVTVDFQHDPVRGQDTVTISGPALGGGHTTLRDLLTLWTDERKGVPGRNLLVSCARLGSRFTLRTAAASDAAWTVVTCDLTALATGSSWSVPLTTESKAAAGEYGTRITVGALRPRPWAPDKQRELWHRLGDFYSQLLREGQVSLTVSRKQVVPRKPCVWGENRSVERQGSEISAIQKVDTVLATLYQCRDCHATGPFGSPCCLQCQGTRLDRIVHRVRGWLGVQRYLHRTDFGIDFYSHGRKILSRDKRLFSWRDDSGQEIAEYPVDPPLKGRLVGEIHCDHVPVTASGTAFHYDGPEWRAVVDVIRGQGPLSAMRAKRLGYAPNTSPLAMLYAGFRRNDPGLRSLIPGDGFKALHEAAAAWADRFHQGDPAYQSDDKWYAAARMHDTLSPAGVPADDRIDLARLTPEELEDLVHRLYMDHHGHGTDAPKVLIGPGRGTVVFRDRPHATERWALQARCYRHRMALEAVQALAGHMLDVQADRGILVTTSWFGADSHAFAQRSGRISLVDGRALRTLLRDHLGIHTRLGLSHLPPGWEVDDIT
ncbi:restriction endonuclease [Streptomyces sp. NBC_01190]|uniref:restriction endonuclease n=1 Tax=Streptomyces sp. NBC_01190 TaxID=2903767 RepID=UPI0038692439|nr:restriction endonuclease [Streptomyces sp. NBC_01190]WSS24143.1 restriction endonuclease [Streptomyces sp. NBC_01190]